MKTHKCFPLCAYVMDVCFVVVMNMLFMLLSVVMCVLLPSWSKVINWLKLWYCLLNDVDFLSDMMTVRWQRYERIRRRMEEAVFIDTELTDE